MTEHAERLEHAHRDNRGVKPYLSICGIYRDEAPYLREWIEFHRLVGVERFYLYDNFSEDDHREVLAPYVSSGIVVLHDWPLMPGQLEAYAHCLGAYRAESRWIAFIDHDEFLFSPTMRPVSEVLREFEEFPGVVANCLAFGTSGHMTRPAGLVIENYTRRTDFERRNRIVKSVVDPLRVARPGNDPHYFRYFDRAKAVNERREIVRGDRSESLACDLLRINHYITRSQEERDRKLAGLVAFTGEPKRADRARELDKMLDAVVDETILAYLAQLRQALAEPVGPPAS
jgi:hypothetical protein